MIMHDLFFIILFLGEENGKKSVTGHTIENSILCTSDKEQSVISSLVKFVTDT